MEENEFSEFNEVESDALNNQEENEDYDDFDYDDVVEKVIYKTNEVAKILGESPQMIRHYCSTYAFWLKEIKTTPKGHRLFSEENVEELRKIINLLKKEGMTEKNVIDQLSSAQGIIEVMQDSGEKEIFDKFLHILRPKLQEMVTEIIVQAKSEVENKELLADTLISEATKEIKASNEKLIEANGIVANEIRMLHEKQTETDKQLTEMVESLKKQNEDLIRILEEKNKKKGFRGIFGK